MTNRRTLEVISVFCFHVDGQYRVAFKSSNFLFILAPGSWKLKLNLY